METKSACSVLLQNVLVTFARLQRLKMNSQDLLHPTY